MDKKVTIASVALRVLLGWYMFAAGFEKIIDPNWTAKGFLMSAKTFHAFYAWFALPGNAWWIDPLNSWGITLIGVALILGVGLRPAAWAGSLLMILYYFPHYRFPEVPHGFIVEDHVIFIAAFLLLAYLPQASEYSLAPFLKRTFLGRLPLLRSFI